MDLERRRRWPWRGRRHRDETPAPPEGMRAPARDEPPPPAAKEPPRDDPFDGSERGRQG
jgi:hypothetical protein